MFTTAPGVKKAFESGEYGPRLAATGVILSCICPLMYMNNPLCGPMPVITCSNKLRTYTTARYYTRRKSWTGSRKEVPANERVSRTCGGPGLCDGPGPGLPRGLNTLASFQKALQFGDKKATCGDQNNPDLYGKPMAGKALCLPQTIGSTTGGLVLYCACSMNRQPACLLFSNPIDSLAAAGSVLAAVWLDDISMPVIDCLGEDFLAYVKDGMTITVKDNGVVQVD